MPSIKQSLNFAKRILLLSIPAAAAIIALDRVGAFERFEWMTYDVRTRLTRSEKTINPEVAVILIDEASLRQMDSIVGRWPWPRWVYQDVIGFLTQGGARAVLFDILFTEKEERCTQGAAPGSDQSADQGDAGLSAGDQALIEATAASGIVRHAAQIRNETEDDYNLSLLGRPLPEDLIAGVSVSVDDDFKDELLKLKKNHYVLPIDALYRAAAGIGVVNVDPDADGVYRRAELFSRYDDVFFPTFGLSGLIERGNAAKITFRKGELDFGETSIPLSGDGTYLINYYGDYKAYSMSGVMVSVKMWSEGDVEGLFDGSHISPYDFENKIVFIGSDADGLSDRKALPISGKAPGVFIHASIAGNILDKDFLTLAPPIFNAAAVGFFSLLTIAMILAAPKMWLRIVGPLLLGAGYSGVGLFCFSQNMVLPVAAPAVAILAAWVEAFAYRESTEDRRRRRVRKMFSQYVSPEVLAELEKRPEEQLVGEIGRKEPVTIFFSDIRGFTSLSESLPPTSVVEILNVYFSSMTDVAFVFGGTIDKFIGDAIMCLWGAPIQTADHAVKAVKCALSMTEALENVNATLVEKGFPALKIGIGINTGDVVVGNIGSDKKVSYTAIGDDVNLASRIEGLTKTYGVEILISQYTFERLDGEIACAVVDLVRVKGKQAPIKIHRPLASASDGDDKFQEAKTLAAKIGEAFEAYLARQWQRAIELYTSLPDEQVNRVFINRSLAYLKNPPPANWDGVHEMTTK